MKFKPDARLDAGQVLDRRSWAQAYERMRRARKPIPEEVASEFALDSFPTGFMPTGPASGRFVIPQELADSVTQPEAPRPGLKPHPQYNLMGRRENPAPLWMAALQELARNRFNTRTMRGQDNGAVRQAGGVRRF